MYSLGIHQGHIPVEICNRMDSEAIFSRKITLKQTQLKYIRQIAVRDRIKGYAQDHQDHKLEEIQSFLDKVFGALKDPRCIILCNTIAQPLPRSSILYH